MKKLSMTLKSLLILSILFLGFSCSKNSDVQPTITVVSQTDASELLYTGSRIEIKVDYGESASDVTPLWFVNGKSYLKAPNFIYDVEDATSLPSTLDIELRASTSAGEVKQNFTYTVVKYNGGIFLINEGWYGHDNGSVNYYIPSEQKIITNVIDDSAAEFGGTGTCGEVYGRYLYVASKVNTQLVKSDIYSFKSVAALSDSSIGQGQSFAVVDENIGVLTTSKGLYVINLNTMLVDRTLSSDGSCGDILVDNGYLYVTSKAAGLQIFKTSDFSLVSSHAGATFGFAKMPNGKIFAIGANKLFEVSNNTDVSEIDMPVSFPTPFGFAWRPTGFVASNDNQLFIAKIGSWGGGNTIYRYVDGDAASLTEPFVQGDSDDAFYGAGIGYDKENNTVMANFVDNGWGESYTKNRIVHYSAESGQEVSKFVYPEEYYWFPSSFVK